MTRLAGTDVAMMDARPPAAKTPAAPTKDDPGRLVGRREQIGHLALLLVLVLTTVGVFVLGSWLFWTLLELTPAAVRFSKGAE